MINIGVLISGGGSNLQALIDNIKSGMINAQIKIVVSDHKSAFGLQRAENENIKAVFVSKKMAGNNIQFHNNILEILQHENIDLVVLAGYLSILTPLFIETYKNKIINIHPALLPAFGGNGMYGLKVHEAVLNYGAKISGATVHFVDEGTDTGAIILQESVEVLANDTPETLQKRVLSIEHKLLPLAVKYFAENKLQIIENKGNRTIVKING